MKLYYDPRTVNCRKVVAGFKLMGIDFETADIDYFAQGHLAPEYMAINPNASLPALVDGDLKLWESNAILQYAADKAGAASAYPADLKVRADINRWLLWEANLWFPSTYVYLVENVVKPILGAEPDQAILDGEAERFNKLAGILDAQLAGRDWVSTPDPSIADIALAAPMHLHRHQKLPLENYGNIRAWIARMEELPAWKSTDVAPLLGLS
ncbi:MAG: glutathione S-transferase family protein [Rhodospirillaceae bacterium]|jgi:glutathione S-transferase|nr:glutathione S-transferase family protein [Rhodospirillaceae bacterium]MBT4687258.1 glutathione S-transferase family protein [Rhodospirillaceae bacterium]MBT5082711.1 glutathione S-transferase family protein [Rhodospirillaceae bacterium]MBT5524125.1 glutathione S-transferase family protein [Rhodospirillaceae bacterium]MBT5880802.1 glutathione S-transferase family protein [Rhodospirillaceae bacterium]